MMLKSKLEQGMKVIFANNKQFLVVGDQFVGLNGGGFSLSTYTENLISGINKDFNIKKVYKFNGTHWIECVSEIKEHYSHVINYDVIFDGSKTTVVLESGTQASTTCLPEDNYVRSKGIAIAYMKVAIKGYMKNLKILTK